MDGNDLRIKLEHERGRFGMDEQDKSKFNLGCTDRGSRGLKGQRLGFLKGEPWLRESEKMLRGRFFMFGVLVSEKGE
ncbi:hypothetical protein DEO72_LG9g1331 [Vigna unguiculata]|uniref:Uncharacterized protein n=1 Tax=Vigna unguiculata TaxID=3917 RepID=A0A4D6MXS3_VIGUN|nr:hypothetical protein DEO72_LG9g1331 [Vigna unguiculata]